MLHFTRVFLHVHALFSPLVTPSITLFNTCRSFPSLTWPQCASLPAIRPSFVSLPTNAAIHFTHHSPRRSVSVALLVGSHSFTSRSFTISSLLFYYVVTLLPVTLLPVALLPVALLPVAIFPVILLPITLLPSRSFTSHSSFTSTTWAVNLLPVTLLPVTLSPVTLSPVPVTLLQVTLSPVPVAPLPVISLSIGRFYHDHLQPLIISTCLVSPTPGDPALRNRLESRSDTRQPFVITPRRTSIFV